MFLAWNPNRCAVGCGSRTGQVVRSSEMPLGRRIGVDRHMTPVTIGLISDTHGLLRPEAVRALGGVSRIIHAGDIGGAVILQQLAAIAPVEAVKGNNDTGPWAEALPNHLALELAGIRILVLHDIKEMDLDPATAGFDVVISGHSHKPSISDRNGIRYINPGSAGPRRFKLPITLGLLEVKPARGGITSRIVSIV